MPVLYANRASSTLASSITNVATSLAVGSGHGARFPAISGGDYFYATLDDNAGNVEIVRVTGRSGDTFTITRAQDGTSALAFSAGAAVELRIVRALLDDFKADTRTGYAPLTGTGASGTWGISISGNAATVSSITSAQVTTALGFTPYNATNPSGYITSAALSSYLPLTGGTLTGALTVGTAGSSSTARALRIVPTGVNPSSFGSYPGSWRSTLEIWDNAGTRMIHVTPPDGTNYNYSSIKSLDAGLRIDVGSNGGVNALSVETNGVVNAPQGLQSGGQTVLNASNFGSYALPLSGGTLSGSRPISFSPTAGNLRIQGDAAGWAMGLFFNGSSGTDRGGFGALGSADSLSNFYVGPSHSSPWMTFASGSVNSLVSLQQGGNQVLHAGNFNSYAPTLTGGGASGTWGINVTGSSGSSSRSIIEDTRAAQRTPDNYDDYRVSYEFTNALTGLGDWHSAMTMQGWHNAYAAWQIIGPASTSAHENFYLRSGVNATWNPARAILHSGNFGSYALPLGGGTVTGVTTFSNTQDWQLRVDGAGTPWAGIFWSDSDGSDTIYFRGLTGTYAIGGGGSAVSGKKLHVNGGTTIGSGYAATSVPSNGLNVEGAIQQAGNQVLHAGNFGSYALPLSGGTVSGITLVKRNLGTNDYTNVGQHSLHLRLQRQSDLKTLELGVLDNGTGVIQANEAGVGYYTLALNPVSGSVTINSQIALHAGNFNSYSPSLTGGGASGTWGINVTGNANTASLAIWSNTYNFTTPSSGWYRVATTGGDGRGTYNVELHCTGGNHNPSLLQICAQGDWGNDKIVYANWDGNFPANAVRITRSSTNTFLEVFFTAAIAGATIRVNRSGFDNGISGYSGSLPAGGDTVNDTLSVSAKINASSIAAGSQAISGGLSFGSQTRQMINLWAAEYGIGIQSATTYFRSASRFSWFRGGSHNDGENNPGGGTVAMTLDGNNLLVAGNIFNAGNQVLHAGNFASSYLNGTYLRAAGAAGYGNWNSLGNTAQTVHEIYREHFNEGTNTGSSNFPPSKSYSYGALVNFTAGTARAQVYISHAGNDLIFRGGWGTDSWQTWNRVLTDQNYMSYSPSTTGSGASGTWGINISGNAATAGGLSVHSGTNNEANKIVRTDGNGYANFGWIWTASGDQGTNAIDRVYASYDGYIRYYTPANFRTVLDVPTRGGSGASGTWGISISGNAATATSATDSTKLPLSGGTLSGRLIVGVNGRTTSYTGSNVELYTGDNTPPGLSFHRGGYSATLLYESDGELFVSPWTTRGQTGKLLAAGNFNSYAPTLTGGGASGTWGISITGSAGSASSATTATTATNWGAYGGVPAAGTSFANANTIGRSDGNGYTYFNYINSNTGNSENPTVSQVIVTNGGDNFFRKASVAHLTSSLSGTAPINISGNAATATSATTASSANSVAWTNVSGRPTAVSSFSNDAGYITAGAAKAWVNFNGTGTVAIRASFNVSSITDNGVGDYTVNFTTAMADANYSALVTAQAESNGVNWVFPCLYRDGTPLQAGSARITMVPTGGGGGGLLDGDFVCATFFR